jgi:plastocyanin
MRRAWLLAPLLLLGANAPTPAKTGRVTGKVMVMHGGKPVAKIANVAVWVVGFQEPPGDKIPEMRQRNRQFEPSLIPVTAGGKVSFPNGDPFYHNVFSPSDARKFDLGQFRSDESAKLLEFPKPGVIDVFCNIHPEMAATILVLPNQRFAVPAADGSFTIDGVPEGTWDVYAYDRLADSPIKSKLTVTAGGEATIAFTLDETRTTAHKNKYGADYTPENHHY